MYVFVPPWPKSNSQNTKPLKRIPDAVNKEVQALIDYEVDARQKYNLSIWAKVFGKKSVDRESILQELKQMRVMEDDRYFLATMCQERI